MTVFNCPTTDEVGKFRGVVGAFPYIWDGIIVDIGCRNNKLQNLLSEFNKKIYYFGLDLLIPANIIATFENNLPFADKSIDVAIALDVLEHVNDIHRAFGELCRVSRKFVIITLPNAYELKCRVKFLFGLSLGGKYGLPITPSKDRHRWIFSLNEAKLFAHAMGVRLGFELVSEGYLIGPHRSLPVFSRLVNLFPNLLSPCYLALFKRKGAL